MNIVDPILFQCRQQPPTAAICAPGPGIGLISYRRLEAFIHNITRRLLSYGLQPGNIAAIGVEDVIFHVAIMLALTRLGVATISLRNIGSPPIHVDAYISDKALPPQLSSRNIVVDWSWTEGDDQPVESRYVPRSARMPSAA